MRITTAYMTKNDCYQTGRTITPKGIMVHSTATPGVMAAAWFNRWNKPGVNKCTHAFVDDTGVWQYLPWNHRGWHAGGAANDTHIGFEICEPAGHMYAAGSSQMHGYDPAAQQRYFYAAWQNAVDLCVMLCKQYHITEQAIITHSEGYRLGIATNHADVMHWFPRHGQSMDSFRAAVRQALQGDGTPAPTDPPGPGGFAVGDLVAFKPDAQRYYPGSVSIPGWVKQDFYHRVTQTTSGGKLVYKGGKPCVLLGRRLPKAGGSEGPGINTWVEPDALLRVYTDPGAAARWYTVQKGDTLWRIAARLLGSGSRYPEIMAINGLTDTIIVPGQALKVPLQ